MNNSRLARVFLSLILCTVFLAIPAGNVYAMPFKSAVTYGVGTVPQSVAMGDFNMDGKPDLAVANYSSSTISILRGVGDGTFTPAPVSPTVADNPRCVAVGDFNRDGKPDLAVACEYGSNVSILLGNGDGTFGAASNITAGATPVSVAVGDFNLDGKPDLAVANHGSNNVSILPGNGNGTFGTKLDYNVGTHPYSVAAADFNLDGKPDLAAANYDNNDISILINNGSGGFGTASDYTAGTGPICVAVGDFNRDGKPDLAATNYSTNDVSVMTGNGSGGFAAAVSYAVGTIPQSVAVGDFNGDGAPDLAVANWASNNVSILLNKIAAPSISFNAAVNYTLGYGPSSVAMGDFNRDGKPDLAVAIGGDLAINGHTVSILMGNGTGTFAEAAGSPITAGTNPSGVAVCDFNRDGIPDLAVSNYLSDNVSILLGSGSGGFGTAVNYPAGEGPASVAVGDFNRDGWPDLAVGNLDSNNISILTGNGDGTFDAPASHTVGSGPVNVAVGDFNRDGDQDLAVANQYGNIVSILLGNGDGTFSDKAVYPTGFYPRCVALGDFNRDGVLDLAVFSETSGIVSIRLGNGNGTFGSATDYATAGGDTVFVAANDFNRDGKLDLVIVDNYYSRVFMLLGDGSGGFAVEGSPIAVGIHPSSLAVGDFNLDGKPDLATANNSNNVSILLNSSLTGNVFTWGSNAYGELGNNDTANSNVPVRVHGFNDSGYLTDVKAIAGGYDHSLAAKSDGTAWAWGWNGYGQLGDGSGITSHTPVQVKDPVGTGYLIGIIAVDARGERDGGIHSLALKSDGTVYAWGYNGQGQLGNGSNSDSTLPVQAGGLTNVVAIAAGRAHSLALKSDGTVWAWGYNGQGQLGDGSNSDNNTPVQVHGVGNSGYLTGITAIAAGYYHSLAVKSDGTVYAWGANDCGELGNGTNTNSNTPVLVSGLSGVKAVAGGGDRVNGHHSVAVRSDGTVWAWGYNYYGQLGNNTNVNSNVAVQVHGPSDSGYLTGVKAIAAGAWHSVALKTDGTVWAWGDNNWGELGDSSNSDSRTPVQVTDTSNVIAISAGALDSLALIGSRPFAPTVATDNATHILSTTVWLNGTLTDDGGEPCQYHFRYGTSPGNCTTGTTWDHTENKTTGQTFYDICGLLTGTTYYYVAECRNDNGTLIGTGLEKTFTTLSGPTVIANPATSVMANTAILHGNLGSTGGLTTTVSFYSGTVDRTTESGLWQRCDNLTIGSDGAFSLGVMGLAPNTTYYYRCYATNTGGNTWAPDPSAHFTTQANLGLWRNYWEGPGKDWFWFSSGRP